MNKPYLKTNNDVIKNNELSINFGSFFILNNTIKYDNILIVIIKEL